jgi:hypothetical protein
MRVTVGSVELVVELKPNKTADEIYAALPVEAPLNTWGEEFYIKVSGVKVYRETATSQVKVGDVAFWGAGQVLAIFFGRTPMSMGPDPVPADRVNIVGKVIGDATKLKQVMTMQTIKVEKI